MTETALRAKTAPQQTEHFDVAIVGAGISGVGAAYHLTKQCPGTTFVVLEAQDSFGGTWLTHRYPGTRSDSDLYTFGYRFKPWTRRSHRRKRSRSAYPVSAHDLLGSLVEQRQALDHGRGAHRPRRDGAL